MSKLKSLVSKIQLFEKLAFYGERKDFLRAIASPAAGDQMVQDALRDLSKSIYFWGKKIVRGSELRGIKGRGIGESVSQIQKLSTYPTFTIQALEVAEKELRYLQGIGVFQSLGMPSDDVESWTQEIYPQVRSASDTVSSQLKNLKKNRLPEPEEVSSGDLPSGGTMGTVDILGDVPKPKYPPASQEFYKELQSALNRILVNDNLNSPFKTDGLRGPATAAAIKIFKDHYLPKKPNASDAEVLDAAKTHLLHQKYSEMPVTSPAEATPVAVPDASRENRKNYLG